MGENPTGILVALGENWAKGKHGTRRDLSQDSINTTLAADTLLHTGQFHTLIFSTGYTNGTKQISEADAMSTLLATKDPTIFEKVRILQERTSFDTPTNLQEVKRLLQENNIEGPITVVAPEYHLKRTRRIAKGFGMEITTIPAEKVIGIPPRKAPFTEYPLRFLSRLDPYGHIPQFVTRRRLRTR